MSTPTFSGHFSRCSAAKERDSEDGKKQLTIADMFQRSTKRKAEEKKDAKRQKKSAEGDSDVDVVSDCEKYRM